MKCIIDVLFVNDLPKYLFAFCSVKILEHGRMPGGKPQGLSSDTYNYFSHTRTYANKHTHAQSLFLRTLVIMRLNFLQHFTWAVMF
jgi:hypothetical protein